MKKIHLLLILVLAATAATCIALYPRASAQEKALTRMLDALYDGKFEKAESYTVSGIGLDYTGSRAKKLLKAMYRTMRFTVADSIEEEDAARVIVSVTIVDMDQLLDGLSGTLLSDSLSGARSTDRQLYRELIARIKTGEEAMLTSTVTAQLLLTPDGWRVDVENSKGLLAAITGDLY